MTVCRLITLEEWQEYQKLKELSEQTFITIDANGNYEKIQFGTGTIQVADDLPNTWDELVEWAKGRGYLSYARIDGVITIFGSSKVIEFQNDGIIWVGDVAFKNRTPRQMAQIIKALGD